MNIASKQAIAEERDIMLVSSEGGKKSFQMQEYSYYALLWKLWSSPIPYV